MHHCKIRDSREYGCVHYSVTKAGADAENSERGGRAPFPPPPPSIITTLTGRLEGLRSGHTKTL